MKIYSPTQSTLFDTCPFKWYLSRILGVKARTYTRKDLAAAFGKSFGNAFSVFYAHDRQHPEEQSVELATSLFRHEVDSMGELPMELMPVVVKYEKSLQKAVHKWREHDPIPTTWKILGIEQRPSGLDHSYMDLCGRDQHGSLFVWDNKCKMYCQSDSILYEVDEYKDSWQLYHYVWSYSTAMQETVPMYYIYFVVGSPTVKVERYPFAVDPDHLATWYNSAQQLWARMETAEAYILDLQAKYGQYPPIEEITKGIRQSPTHRDRWGRCEMYEPCRIGKGSPYISNIVKFPEVETC